PAALLADTQTAGRGRVSIVGAGPGAADLLTLRALQALQRADVIVHDRLVSAAVLDLARRDARRIDVGKARGHPRRSQAETNALLAHLALQGQHVVRLKGGDPFVFGRGGEELLYLRERGIPVEVVPGITAATGCAAAAGVPLTHRGAAQGITLVTGHGAEGDPDLDWAGLAQLRTTLVVYMGASNAGRVAARLIAHGAPGATPAAVIEHGTLPTQRVLTTTLAGLGETATGVASPALIVIGEVAALGRAPAAALAAVG
ncbi:MAG: uroporphyrinogen-III C-methyltransferase, partial [Alphaproteobacteria bacterium]|nr:uroporphyrinogen-III C-methyltransferase [Alphaproteobacteria bacterium]